MIIKKILLFTALALSCIGLKAQTLDASYFLDFGLNDGTNGDETVSPDANGNHWNNITNRIANNTTVNLKSNTGKLSSINLAITSDFASNGKRNGGLLAPSSALLGEFAIATATSDYFYVDNVIPKGALRLSGLNPEKSYVFKIFGTRETEEVRISQYKITGANSVLKTLQTSGAGIGGGGYNGNNNNILVSDHIIPSATGTIDVELTKAAGNFGYVGIIKIEEYTPVVPFRLENTGFESGNLNSWDLTNNVTNLVTNAFASAGSYSFKVSGQGEEISQTISYQNGSDYKLSGYIYQTASEKLAAGQVAFLQLSFYNQDNDLLSTVKSDSLTHLSETDKWLRFETRATVPAQTSLIKAAFVWKSNTAGTIYFDDMVLSPYVPVNENWTKLYIDLGPNDGTNGNSTASPDVNGNSWNNLTDGNATVNAVSLLDYSNKASGVYVTVTKSFFTNGILNGGLLTPSASLLGEYAINTATQDYFFVDNNSGVLKFAGLQKNKKYVFHFFGSRENTETRTVEYILTGANTSSKTSLISGTGIGSGGYNANNNVIVTSDTVYVDMNGSISLEVKKTAGTYGHLNLIKIEAFDNSSSTKYAIDNQGFEYGDLRSWTKDATSLQSVAEVNTERPYKGTYAVKLMGDNVGLSQQINYTGNYGFYKASGYFYKTAALQDGQTAMLTLSYFDGNSQLLSSSQSEVLSASFESDKWQKLETFLEVPSGAKYVKATLSWANTDKKAGFVYFDDLALEPYIPLNPLKIAYFGSSVPYGQGATNKNGYTSLYTSILNARAINGGKAWETVNISVPGDNTVKVLNRYDSDLLPQKAKYVVFALALGNEGIHENGQPAFDQFKANMKILIDKARADGFTPVVTNSYTRNDYTATDYNYIKQMNLLIHSWDVPSVNLLGAIDDLTGHWVDGYWDDALHPNDAGHREMSYTLVPSLFDALDAKKPLPHKLEGSSVTFVKAPANNNAISFTPENIVHSFTVSFSFKTVGSGTLIQLKDATIASMGTIAINNGVIRYNSAKGGSIIGSTPGNDNKWHKVTLTHYYAKGTSILYLDSIAQGQVNEKLVTTNLKIGGLYIPEKLEYKDLLFYRSAINAEEVRYIARDSLLRSSLELYAPLDGKMTNITDSLANLAQSTNTLLLTSETGIPPVDFSLSRADADENNGLGYVIGYFTAQNANQTEATTYSLVNGQDGTDNQLFTIEDNLLKASAVFDYEQKQSYSIRVRATSASGAYIEKSFTIKINSLATPVDFSLSRADTDENNGLGYVIGYFTTQNASQTGTITYSLANGQDGTDNQFFTIEDNLLKAAVVFDYEQKQAYSIRVRATSVSGASIEKSFTIKINNLAIAGDLIPKPSDILTPNGDGINDTWVIANIETYKDSEVSVFDQMGKKIYTQKNYTNNWEGGDLKPGLYLYVIIPAPSQKPIKGYLTILR